jgi:hypothetical protein
MPPDTELYQVSALGTKVKLAVVYAPQRPQELREQLRALQAALASHPDALVVGDLNAHVGHAGAPEPRHGHSDPINASGRVLLQWLEETGRQIMNGQQHLARATHTWARPGSDTDQRRRTMLDLVLAPDAEASRVLSVNTTQAPAISDHRMVIAVLSCDLASLAKWKQVRVIRDLESLQPKTPGVWSPRWRYYHQHITQHLQRHDQARRRGEISAEGMWRILQAAVKRAYRVHIRSWKPPELYKPPSKHDLHAAVAWQKALEKRLRRLHRRVKRAQQAGAAESTQAAATQRAAVARAVREAAKSVTEEARLLERAQRHARTLAATAGILSSDPVRRNQKHTHNILLGHDRDGPRHGAGQCRRIDRMVKVTATGEEVVRNDGDMAELYAQHLAQAGVTRRTHPVYAAAQQRAEAQSRAEPHPRPDTQRCPPTLDLPDVNADFTAAEVEEALRRTPYHKAGGPDGINSTSLKFVAPPPKPERWANNNNTGAQAAVITPPGSKLGCEWLATMFNRMLEDGRLPQGFMHGFVVPIPKGKPKPTPAAFRPITLLNTTAKLLDKMIDTRLRTQLEGTLRQGELNAGFRPARQCADNVFILGETMRARTQRRHPDGTRPMDHVPDPTDAAGHTRRHLGRATANPVVIMLDLKAAFDSVDQTVLAARLHAAGVTGRIWTLTVAMLRAHTREVKVNAARSAAFAINTGVPQGACTSPTLFDLFFTILTTEVAKACDEGRVDPATPPDLNRWPRVVRNADGSLCVDYGVLCVLAYADDIVLECRNWEHANLCLQAVAVALHYIGSSVNAAKSWRLGRARGQNPLYTYKVQDGRLVLGEEVQATATLSKRDGNAYLGMALTSTMSYRKHRKYAVDRTVSQLGRACAFVTSHGLPDPKLGVILIHQAYSTLLYTAEVWASVRSQEPYNRVKSAAARAVASALDLRRRPNRNAALGELGLLPPDARVFQQRLAYWFELLLQPDSRPTRYAYNVSVAALRGDTAAGPGTEPALQGGGRNWADDTQHMLGQLHMAEAWCNADPRLQLQWMTGALRLPDVNRNDMSDFQLYGDLRERVRNRARDIVRKWAEKRWHRAMSDNPRTATTAQIHRHLTYARYLDARYDLAARDIRLALRTAAFGLHDGEDALRCPACGREGRETVEHFVLRCRALAGARQGMWLALRLAVRTPTLTTLLAPGSPQRDAVALALVLGGNLDHLHGLEEFHMPRSAAPTTRGAVHPALDRLHTLRATAPILRRLARRRNMLAAE